MPSLSELIAQHKAATAQQSSQPATSVVVPTKEAQNVAKPKLTFALGGSPSTNSVNSASEKKAEVLAVAQSPVAAKTDASGAVLPLQPPDKETTAPVSLQIQSVPTAVPLAQPAFDVTNILMTGVDAIAANSLDGFRNTLQIIRQAYQDYGNITDMNLVIHAMKNILLEVKGHPEFVKLLLPEDIGMLVRILRESYGIAVTQKTERSSKRKASQADMNEFREMLDGFGELKL